MERSAEACQILNPNVRIESVSQIYDLLEETHASKISNEQIVRVQFGVTNTPLYTVEIHKLAYLPPILNLQCMTELKQLGGMGKQNYKWTNREFWSQVMKLKRPEVDDVMCCNEKNEITETSRFNLFFYESKADVVYTPPLHSGCINGVYRRYAIENKSIMLPKLGLKKVIEKSILASSVEQYQIFAANSIREVLMAKLLV